MFRCKTCGVMVCGEDSGDLCTSCKHVQMQKERVRKSPASSLPKPKLKTKKAKKRAKRSVRKITDRPLTSDTEFLVCVWDYRGDKPSTTATILCRSTEQIKKILKKAKDSGRYDKHIKTHLMFLYKLEYA